MKLLRTFPKDAFEFGLASWRWLGLREQTPRFATCFGDIFLESLDGWWFLDTVEGTLELRWTSAVTMYAELESPEGRATYLMDDLVREARGRGLHLGEEDVYTFNPHPALGGELGVGSLVAMRFELAVNWVGQMHDQVLHGSGEIDLPPLPDDGRRGAAPLVAAAWDSAWSRDETFDVPFEQYLATTTFAAVAAPRHGGGGRPAPAGHGAGEPGAVPYAAQHHGPVPEAPAMPPSDPSVWSGQTASAQAWAPSDPTPQPVLPEQYAAAYDPTYPAAPEQYGAAEPEPGAPYAEQAWPAPDGAGLTAPGGTTAWGVPGGSGADWAAGAWTDGGAAGEHLPEAAAPYDDLPGHLPGYGTPGTTPPRAAAPGTGWADPGWANPGWGTQAPAVAAGGGPQQAPRTDDPFTAWDDLWGKR